MFGEVKNLSAHGVKRTHFQRFGNPAVGHAETVQTDCGQGFLVGGRQTSAYPIVGISSI